MSENMIRLSNSTDVETLTNEIVELVRSGKVVGIEVMGQTSNMLAIEAMIEARGLLADLGFEMEMDAGFEQLDNPNSKTKKGIKWTVKTKGTKDNSLH